MVSLITLHNWSILKPNNQVYNYKCRVTVNCPLEHECLRAGIAYQATITNNKISVENFYYGLWKLLVKKGTEIIPILLDMRKIEIETEVPHYI